MDRPRLLIDAREFVPDKRTGIGRFLEGLLAALIDSDFDIVMILATASENAVPRDLLNREKTILRELPASFLSSERALTDLARREVDLFLSPYPKLPLFGSHCPAANTIHDVLDITHPAYKKRFKTFFDTFRLRSALKMASLTWYDSVWSLKETEKRAGFVGKEPRVRYLAIDERFRRDGSRNDDAVLAKYRLRAGYIIVVGNGMLHKNLGVLLKISEVIHRPLVFVGVSEENQKYWRSSYPNSEPIWISHASDGDLPALIRGAFCLAQPSTTEGYGYPPLEAMACGIPAVVSSIPVLVETTGGQALTADPKNPQTWMEVFNALEKREVYRDQVGKSLKWVEPLRGRNGWKKHVADIEKLLMLKGP
jgi:glycosyltransferase involved in cell wall biosynthesis